MTDEASEVGSIAMKALPAPKARRVSRTQAHRLMSRGCFGANGVDVESIEAGEAKHRAIVSEGPGSANCAGSRAPPTVTVMHAPTGQRDGPDQGTA